MTVRDETGSRDWDAAEETEMRIFSRTWVVFSLMATFAVSDVFAAKSSSLGQKSEKDSKTSVKCEASNDVVQAKTVVTARADAGSVPNRADRAQPQRPRAP